MLDSPEIDPYFFYGTKWSQELVNQPSQGGELKKKLFKSLVPNPYALFHMVKSHAFKKGSAHIDVYHEPNYVPLSFDHKLVLTVHDVSFIRYPETHPAERIRALKRFPEAVSKADAIITDSYFTARELMDCLPVDPAKVHPIHLGVSSQYRPRNKQDLISCLQQYKLEYKGFILVVGTLEPRKNLRLVLDAYRAMPENIRKYYPLVVIGMKGWGADQVGKDMRLLVNSGHLRLLGYVPSDDLPLLYAAAKLFVYPSLYEGFGLPPLEAMASGVPVITSNRSSLPEVVGEAGVQVEAQDVEGLRLAMSEVLDDTNKATKMVKDGLRQAEKFSWKSCASSTIDVYKGVAGL